MAADEALQRFNEAMQSPQSGTTRLRQSDVGAAVVTTPAFVNEVEPNNTSGTANAIATLLSGERYVIVSASISPAADADYFSFTAAAGSRIWVEADTGGTQNGGATSVNSIIDILAADGTTVIESDDDDGIGNGGDGTTETESASIIAGRALTAGGTYYVRVRESANTGIISPYRLLVVLTTAAATFEAEGNDVLSFANAAVPTSGTFGLRSGILGAPGEVDYYSIAATEGSILYYAVDGDADRDGVGTDLVLELRNKDDVVLQTVNSSAAGSAGNPAAEGSNFTIPADGVYYIKVRHFSAAATGSYDLMTAISTPEEDEPNGTAATAEPIVFTSTARRVAILSGAINPGGDTDFYSFPAPAGARVWIAADTGGLTNPGSDSRDTSVDLIGVDGATVIETDDDDGTGNGGDGVAETGLASIIAGRTLVAGGTYFIRVRAFSGTAIINPYKLFVVVTSSAGAAEVEGNETAASATSLTTTGSSIGMRTATIGSAGDIDYYSIVAAAGSVIYFSADADPERDGAGTDLVLELRSPADAVLLTVDSSISGSLANPAAEGANYMVTDIAGTYYLRVRHFGTGTGTYHVMAIASTGSVVPGFTDTPLTAAVSTIRAIHVSELRTRINALRGRWNLAAVAWSHPNLAGAFVSADDLTELRTAIQQVYGAAGLSAPAFTDPVITATSTVIKAAHIEQLRSAVLALESS